jgi:hypothetical protein
MRHLTLLTLFAAAIPAAAHHAETPCLLSDDGVTVVCPERSTAADVAPTQVILTDGSETAALKEEAQTESTFLKFLGALITLLMPIIVLLMKNWRDMTLAKKDESKLNMGIGIALQLFTAFLTEARLKLEPKLKEALADGIVTPEERKVLIDTLVSMALSSLPGHVMGVLQSAFGSSLQTWLAHQATETVDAAVAKAATPSPQ